MNVTMMFHRSRCRFFFDLFFFRLLGHLDCSLRPIFQDYIGTKKRLLDRRLEIARNNNATMMVETSSGLLLPPAGVDENILKNRVQTTTNSNLGG